MAVSSEQYQSILARITTIELTLNNLITAINHLVSLQQVNALTVQWQTDIADIRTDLDALTSRVSTIEEESFE